jgi:hypothetical protein
VGLDVLAGVSLLLLATVHVLAGPLLFDRTSARGRWLSFGSGASVAYVFLHLLPEVTDHERALARATDDVELISDPVWLLALVGLVGFYGLEHHTHRSRARTEAGEGTETGTFAAGIALFGVFNATVGYLLVRSQASDARELVLFSAAVGVHLLVVDFALRDHHRADYHRVGRWLLAVALFTGGAVGYAWRMPDAALGGLLAFLCGGIILNTLKEELPRREQSHFGAFAGGAGLYTLFLLLV